MHYRYKKRNDGFTMVEIIIVFVVIAILAAIVIPVTLSIVDSADEVEVAADAKSIWNAAQSVFNEQLANEEHFESNNSKYGVIINKFTKKADGSDRDLSSNSIYDNNIATIIDLEIASKILKKIDNEKNIEAIFIGAGRYYDYYQGDDADKAYKVYILFFKYADNDTVYYYDGKTLTQKWPLDNPKINKIKTDSNFKMNGTTIQFYCLKKKGSGKAIEYLRSIVKE